MTITMTTDQARLNWRDTIDKAYAEGTEVVLQRYNKPVVVMVNYDLWQMFKQQRFELLKRLSQEVKDGNFVTQEEVEQGLRERGLI